MDWQNVTPRSLRVLVPLAALTLAGSAWVESGQRVVPSPHYDQMLRAAQLSEQAATALKRERLERGAFVDAVNDPAETALIGQEYTQITTDRGDLDAKLASTDPNFAAVILGMLHQLDLEPGDCAAVAMTGSFPALNLSTLAALEVFGADTVLITSVGASNFGATDPYFTWLDMERVLVDDGILRTRSTAASMGGGNDTGRGLSPKGRQLLLDAIERADVTPLVEKTIDASIRRRVELYRAGCGERPIAVYINVGGGVASLGHSLNGELVPSGSNQRLPTRNYPARGAMMRIADGDVPVIHLLNVRRLRDRYGLEPVREVLPKPGTGRVFGDVRYDLVRTSLVTAVVLGALIALFLLDRRAHRLGTPGPTERPGSPGGVR
ncbi:MAG: poly-gamma-glutamate system protein [Acidobacteriota bacterium]